MFKFLKKVWWDDPYEKSATIAFGILCPLGILFFLMLIWLSDKLS